MKFHEDVCKLALLNTQSFLQVPDDLWDQQVSAAIGRISAILWQRMDAGICLDWGIPLKRRDGSPVTNQYGEATQPWKIFNGQYYKLGQEILIVSETDKALAAQLQAAVIAYEQKVKRCAAKAKDSGKTPFDILDEIGSFWQQKGFWHPQDTTPTTTP